MIPMRHSSIFKSRWMALLWAAGIIWLAMDVAGRADPSVSTNSSDGDDGSPQRMSQKDADALAKFLK